MHNETITRRSLDERALTVYIALAAWTGAVGGAIVALGGFNEPKAIDNGYVRLAALAVGSMMLGMTFHARQAAPSRRFQLGMVLSLLLHTALVAGLAYANLSMLHPLAQAVAPPVKEPDKLDVSELVIVDRTESEDPADFERPVESGAAQMKTDRLEQQRHDAPKLADAMTQPTEAPALEQPAPQAPQLTRPTATLAQADIALGERSRSVASVASIAPQAVAHAFDRAVENQSQPDPTPRPRQPELRQPLARQTPALVAPVTPTRAPVASAAPAAPVLPRANPTAAAGAITPTLAARSRPSSRPRSLARLGPAPMEAMAQLPSSSASAQPAQSMAPLAPTPMANHSPRPAPATAPPTPAAMAPLDSFVDSPTAPAPARPQRLAMRGDASAPRVLSGARPRGRAAPLASLGTSGKALSAPAELMRRRNDGQSGRTAQVNAPKGRGGLGSKPANAAGIERLAANRNAAASRSPGRFRNTPSGGSPSVAGSANQPAAAFSSRGKRLEQARSGSQGSPSPRTEAAIELGLEFLARVQRDDGSWAFDDLGGAKVERAEVAQGKADGAATGLALLSFLGAGYDHTEGRHREVVRRGIQYLIDKQTPDGLIFPEADGNSPWQVARFYSHGIASIAMCEAYGMTGDPKLRRPAQRALDYIAGTQVTSRGGWRYTPGMNSDLSVTGWMLMALRSGELAGLDVSTRTYAGVRQFLESCRERAGDRSRFCYNPLAQQDDPRTAHGRNPGTVMTSVGLLMQLYLGEGRESPRMQRGADHLLENLPTTGDSLQPARTSTLANPLRDTYYWYYGTQVMFHMGGRHWDAWNDSLHPLLIETQTTAGPLAGSWNPLRPTPDKWRHIGGRLYVTTLNLLSLEVYYRHLPLYEMTGK